MKTFTADLRLNPNSGIQNPYINYYSKEFDFNVFQNRELVSVILGKKEYECFISSSSNNSDNSWEITFTIVRIIECND